MSCWSQRAGRDQFKQRRLLDILFKIEIQEVIVSPGSESINRKKYTT